MVLTDPLARSTLHLSSPKLMKIVHVVYSMEMGGAESLVAQLCRLQRRSGHEVTVFAQSNLGTLGEALRTEGFRVDVPGTGNPLRTLPRYLRAFRKLRPDVVHCHNPAPTLQAAIAARLAGTKRIISTRHSLVAPPYDMAAELQYGIVSRFCDSIVGICEATCENLRHAPLARRSRIVRVYNGAVGLQRVPAAELPEKRGFTLLFVGRLAPVKDLSTLLRAVALAAHRLPGLQLWIVGDGHERVGLEGLTAQLGIEDHVTFFGERHDIARFFTAADVFAMSSVSEGLPISLLQAMSIGLPALVTDVGGMAEVVRNAGCGVRVPVGDSQSMANAIVEIASDAEERSLYAARGIGAFQAQFTIEKMSDSYMGLYRKNSPATNPSGTEQVRGGVPLAPLK